MSSAPHLGATYLLLLAAVALPGEPAAAGFDGEFSGELAAGERYACAAATDGLLYCWGHNHYGQLGDGTNENRVSPQPVSGISAGVLSVDANRYHTCAVTSAGAALCWGRGGAGQLGDGDGADSSAPVGVVGLGSGVVEIATGTANSCALTSAGGVLCWGANYHGGLGDGTNLNSTVPVPVSGLASGVVALEAGTFHNCALTVSGSVLCWGLGDLGQLGDGNATRSNVPIQVAGLSSGVDALAVGDNYSCASIGAQAFCWGMGGSGQLGDGEFSIAYQPVAVAGTFTAPIELAAGLRSTCALDGAGVVQCWGSNQNGQLGDGTTVSRPTPVIAAAGLDVIAIATGWYHTCAVTPQGSGHCWGRNTQGQLGVGTGPARSVPGPVANLAGAQAVSAGVNHTCAVTSGGAAVCWGSNAGGKLGDGTTEDRAIPVGVQGLSSGVAAVAAGSNSCALRDTGEVLCWGVGDGTLVDSATPVPVSGLAGVAAIAAGSGNGCALRTTGELLCWGRNSSGQLGDGSTSLRTTPTPVASSESFAAVALGTLHTCAVTYGGAALCWGRGSEGQLGDGGTADSSVPVQVSGLTSGVASIAAGYGFSCALLTSGEVRCWGRNGFGELGDGTYLDRLTPVAVVGISDAVELSSGTEHTCALDSSGSAACWGAGYDGQLGNGATADSENVPQPVSGLSSGVALSLGWVHSCALTGGGGVQCWGDNRSVQLGDGWNPLSNPNPLAVPEPSLWLGLASALAALLLLDRLRRRR